MKIVLYGMPCAGKSTLMEKVTNARVITGSKELERLCGGSFSELSEEDKRRVRAEYVEYLKSLEDEFIVSDGHFSFMDDVVFTEADCNLYDVFIYVYCKPETLKRRYAGSDKNAKFADLSTETINQWQDYEIRSLREACHEKNKDFYVVSDSETEQCAFLDFLKVVHESFSSLALAKEICEKITEKYPAEEVLYLVDGDRTIINEDSYRDCCNGNTRVFDGDFYSGYQSFLFSKELKGYSLDGMSFSRLSINDKVYQEVKNQNFVVLSAGIGELWDTIASEKALDMVFADPYICADTKYYVVKILQEQGYTVYAYGDSKIDLYMLRTASKGNLYIGKRLSRSLQNESLSGLRLIYDHSPVILADEADVDSGILDDIAICKSNSEVNGNRLAAAHYRLGNRIGNRISKLFPEHNTVILELERGGRFFGDGVYIGFGGTFYPINSAKDPVPKFDADRIIIVDSVINTGKSMKKMISLIKEDKPDTDVIIAANVIQAEALDLLIEYKVFAVRLSQNSYIGKNQAKQTGKTGPDTADRLFNLIEKRFR